MFSQLFLNLLRALFFFYLLFAKLLISLALLSQKKKLLFFYLIQIYKKKFPQFSIHWLFFVFPADAPKSEGIMLRQEMNIIY